MVDGATFRRLGAAALAMSATLAPAAVIELAWDAGQRFQQALQVAPAGFVELCGKLAPGARVQWRFDAAAPLDFNVHYHEGKAVRFPAKEDGVQRSEGALDVSSAQDYCWMWTNTSRSPVALTVELHRAP